MNERHSTSPAEKQKKNVLAASSINRGREERCRTVSTAFFRFSFVVVVAFAEFAYCCCRKRFRRMDNA
eukprot:ANDGO_00752.mRNA.1 hypothetical protein